MPVMTDPHEESDIDQNEVQVPMYQTDDESSDEEFYETDDEDFYYPSQKKQKLENQPKMSHWIRVFLCSFAFENRTNFVIHFRVPL